MSIYAVVMLFGYPTHHFMCCHVLFQLIQGGLAGFEPVCGEIVQQASNTHLVNVETAATQPIEEVHDRFSVAHRPQQG